MNPRPAKRSLLRASRALAITLFLIARGADAAPELRAPTVVETSTPEYPPARVGTGAHASVLVLLTVDANGRVVDAKITESDGDDFDAAALAAARRLVFAPATRDGAPVASRVPYRFELVDPTPQGKTTPGTAGEPTSAPAVLVGAIRTTGEEPIPGAVVTVTRNGVAVDSVATGEGGAFRFAIADGGHYHVRVDAPGFDVFEADEDLASGAETSVVYRARAATKDDALAVDVRGERPPREVTRRVLEAKEIARIPGTNGDALRSLQSMPGVGRPPGLMGMLIVRGSAPEDTTVFVDGTPIPIAYHFGGLSSVVPTELLERIDFRPGNFGPDYGRAMGGIVDIGLRSPRRDGLHGVVKVDTLDARALVETPLGEHTRIAVGARRSWVDAWLSPMLRATGDGVSTAPRYYDYQAILEQDIGRGSTARLAILGSDDAMVLTLRSPSANDPSMGGEFGQHATFQRVQARIDSRLSADVRWTSTLAYGADKSRWNVGPLRGDLAFHPLTFRSDLRARVAETLHVVGGVDVEHTWAEATVKQPPIDFSGKAATGPLFGRPAPELRADATLLRPGAYAMAEWSPVAAVKILPGVRADYARDTKRVTVDPRLSTRVGLGDTTLKGGVGVYHQPPQAYESVAPFGTPGLRSPRALHYGAGVEHAFGRAELSLDAFYKHLDDLTVQGAANGRTESGVRYSNEGEGRVYGAELLLRYKADERFFGWIAYTLSKSERRERGGAWHDFQYDQTHVLTALGSYRLGRGWEVGGRFRYVTGSPYTPNVGGLADFDAGAYSPVAGAPFSARSGPFHALDLRVEKMWRVGAGTVAAYLDVQNVYSRRNPEGQTYNFNYTRSEPIGGLPILPIIGVRGEL